MQGRRRRGGGYALAAGLALLSAVVATPALAAERAVSISGSAFSPSPLTVAVGDRVTWTNRDSVLHTATAPGEWTTGDIDGGGSASITFREAGTFDYMCAVHPQMRGRLIVKASSMPPTDTAAGPVAGDEGPGYWLVAVLGLLTLLAAYALRARRYGLPRSPERRTLWR